MQSHKQIVSTSLPTIEVVAPVTDISRIRKLEQDYSTAMRELKTQIEMRKQEAEENQRRHMELSDLICHQILNPLNGVEGTLDWLDRCV